MGARLAGSAIARVTPASVTNTARAAINTARTAINNYSRKTLPDQVAKITQADKEGQVCSLTKRPSSFRKKTLQDAWENASPGSQQGTKACPTCGTDIEVAPGQGRRDWDIDHQLPWSKRDLSDMSRKEVLDEFNRGTRLECPGCNRSRGAGNLE
jgi:filamentous hemagglutinin